MQLYSTCFYLKLKETKKNKAITVMGEEKTISKH